MPADRLELHARLRALEAERADLEGRLEQQRRTNRERAAVLADLERGILPPRSKRWLLVLGGLLLVGLGASIVWWQRSAKEQARVATRPLATERFAPHLLVTSSPPGARVSLDGVPRGSTPLFVTASPGRHLVEVSTESGARERREVQVRPEAGAAVEVDLKRPE